ncbi:hypothetical protein [Endozoicomonas atrinae]|uniref:hypothetical protein n=1 Tax=Endozoicomonas atrinae TaxID=1333660 RepID=UPI0008245764|nr:hypothetical protein [Endozoicomonas atrinae]
MAGSKGQRSRQRRRGLTGREKLLFDFRYFASLCLKIRTKSAKVVPLKLNAAQKYLHKRINQQLKRTGKVRIVVLKGRQQGCSTYTEARFYWKVSNQKGLRAYILTHEADATANLFDMVLRYHENLPAFAQKTLSNKSAKQMDFIHDSGYRVGTAGNRGAGRSSTAQLFHGSEVAFWPSADEHLAGVLQAVPNEDDTEVILESTANGVGGVFYDYVMDAAAGRGDFELVFIPWFWQEEYQAKVPAGFTPDDDERFLKQTYHLSDEQLQWRRQKIYELKSEDKFKQEYPCNVEEAFLFSGRPVFDPKHTESAKVECYAPKQSIELTINGVNRNKTGLLQVWEFPKTGTQYVIGCDVAEGLAPVNDQHKHGDYSTIDVCDRDGYQVAHWHGHVAPDDLGKMLDKLGRFYNGALIGVERNNHGLTTVTKLKDLKYPNLYMETTVDQRSQKRTKRLGWQTTTKSKPLMIDHLAALLRDGESGICNKDTIAECQTYVIEDNGATNAQEGCFDDRVISYAIAQQMVLKLPRQKININELKYRAPGKSAY